MALGFVFGAVLSAATWWLLHGASANLTTPLSTALPAAVAGLAFLTGLMAGTAMLRRAGTSRVNLGLFSGMAGGFAGGLTGFAAAAGLTLAALLTYATWPSAWLDDAQMVLSVPVFGGVGFCAGGLAGSLLGLVLGGVLKLGGLVKH
ncbi:MAG: hypothetical protein M3Z66_16035 [Chloroflexota bacterium]|nr:hypothetical protein [Chloroflexota bacterium]